MVTRPKTTQEQLSMRKSGHMLAEILEIIEQTVTAGMTGIDIDELARRELKRLGGKPAFLGFHGFPSTICISINDAVVHGIPNHEPFRKGDVVGFDFGVSVDGMITDAARTFIIDGETTPEKTKLVKSAKEALDRGINQVKDGARTGDIGFAVSSFLDAKGLGNVRDLVGHGVGHSLHEEPEIPNYGARHTGAVLREHMTIAIEPMVTTGDWRVVMDPDGWTIRTRDGSLSAHFEDTVMVTKQGAEILTRL